MRLLVACPGCRRQYDAGQLGEGARFHCLCGATVRVPRPRPHEAAVVRCSSCGAPRQQGEAACRFCGADFTLHERDLHTICPECMARVSDRARFCHHCASPLLPAGSAGEPTDRACPACGNEASLTSRRLGNPGITVLECPKCAGLWLSRRELQLVLERSRSAAPAADGASVGRGLGEARDRSGAAASPRYRPCPVCGKLMHRRNYGRKSGVIVDSCREHGIWFDAEELDRVLRWVRAGGEAEAARQQDEEEREAQRQQRLARQLEPPEADWQPRPAGTDLLAELLAWLARAIFA